MLSRVRGNGDSSGYSGIDDDVLAMKNHYISSSSGRGQNVDYLSWNAAPSSRQLYCTRDVGYDVPSQNYQLQYQMMGYETNVGLCEKPSEAYQQSGYFHQPDISRNLSMNNPYRKMECQYVSTYRTGYGVASQQCHSGQQMMSADSGVASIPYGGPERGVTNPLSPCINDPNKVVPEIYPWMRDTRPNAKQRHLLTPFPGRSYTFL